jgi:hypothetical protein
MEPEKFLRVLVTDVNPLCLKTRLASGMPSDPQMSNYIGKSRFRNPPRRWRTERAAGFDMSCLSSFCRVHGLCMWAKGVSSLAEPMEQDADLR